MQLGLKAEIDLKDLHYCKGADKKKLTLIVNFFRLLIDLLFYWYCEGNENSSCTMINSIVHVEVPFLRVVLVKALPKIRVKRSSRFLGKHTLN